MTMASQNTRDSVPPAETEQQPIQAPPSSPTDPPTVASTSLQQGMEAIPPRGGDEGHAEQIKKPFEVNRDDPSNVVEVPPRSPAFKEQVYGYARLIRGTVLGRPDVKEQGAQVLRGGQGIPLRRGSESSK